MQILDFVFQDGIIALWMLLFLPSHLFINCNAETILDQITDTLNVTVHLSREENQSIIQTALEHLL